MGRQAIAMKGQRADIDGMKDQPAFDRRDLTGSFDIVGDVHGCADELETLLGMLGHEVTWSDGEVTVTPAKGRTIVFVGDLTDRGPRTPDVLRIVMALMEQGAALCVEGNHDNKFLRWLNGANVKTGHGLQASIDQMAGENPAFHARVRKLLAGLPPYLWLDDGKLVVAHAGLKEEMIGQISGKIRSFALYGDTTGETDGFGFPVRRNWALEYRGESSIVYGHVAAPEVQAVNNTWCIDTGCCFGGALSALRWPEKQIVSTPATKRWFEADRPFADRTR
jgi:protein phosphatase